jgi:hypothetical protein
LTSAETASSLTEPAPPASPLGRAPGGATPKAAALSFSSVASARASLGRRRPAG